MKKRILTLLLAAATLLTVAFSMAGCADKRTPVETLTDAAGKTSEQFSGLFHQEVLQAAAKNGSVSVNYKLGDDASINATAYLNEDPGKQQMFVDVDMNYKFRLNMSQDSIAVSSDQLLGDKTYGLDLKTIKEKISRLEDPTGALFIGEDNVAMLKEIVNLFTNDPSETLDLNAMNKRYRELLLKELEDSGKLEKTSGTGEITVSAQLTHEDLTKIFKAFVAELKADQQLKTFLLSLSSIPGTDQMPDSFYEALDNAVKDFEEEEEKSALSFTVVINKRTGAVKNAQIIFLENEKEVGKLLFASETSKITLDYTSKEANAHFQMNLEAKALKSVEGKVVLSDMDEDADVAAPEESDSIEMEFKWEAADASKSDYSYTVKTYHYNELFSTSTLKGTVTVNGKESMVITAESSVDDDDSDSSGTSMGGIGILFGRNINMTITIKANDPAPAFPAYENLLDMSDNALMALINKIGGKIGEAEWDDEPDFDFDDSDFDFDI